MTPDPSPEERAVEVRLIHDLATHFMAARYPAGHEGGRGYAKEFRLVEQALQDALFSAGLHITDQPAGDELHEAQMEAEHYREQLARERETRERLAEVLRRIRQWDMLSETADVGDAAFWRQQIDEALSATGSEDG